MNIKQLNPLKIFKNIERDDFIYLGIFILYFGLVGIIFYSSVNFVSKNVNIIFSSKEIGTSPVLDINRYSLIEKKLNLPKNTSNDNNEAVAVPTTPIIAPSAATPVTTDNIKPANTIKAINKAN